MDRPTGGIAAAAGSGVSGATAPTGPVDPDVRGDQDGADGRRAAGQSPGPAAGDDDVVQPGPGLLRSAPAVDAIRQIEQEAAPAGLDRIRASRAPRRCSRTSLKGQGVLVLAAVFASFVVLGILYESFIHPITIISGLPSAGVGALIVLMMFKMDLSVIAMIGIVMLVGHRQEERHHDDRFRAFSAAPSGLSAEEAIREACLLRFRPIMMTTFAAIFGALPIALGRRRRRRVAPAARRRGGRRACACRSC